MIGSTIVKVCGVTQKSEVAALQELDVDFFGMVVGFDVGHAVSIKRAATLIAYAEQAVRGTIVTTETRVDALSRLVEDTRAPAIQLAGFTSAHRVSKLRQRFDKARLTIMQVIHFQDGRAAELAYLDAYAKAGVDYFILDRVGSDGALGSTGESIDMGALSTFRENVRCPAPYMVAGGVNVHNVQNLLEATGAIGIDVASSVRTGSGVDIEKVSKLIGTLK